MSNVLSIAHSMLGQTPTDYCTPLGLPQDACAVVSGIASVQSATNYNASNVLATFVQWYAALNGGSAPPANNSNGDYTSGTGTSAGLIVAAATYWASLGTADPTNTSIIDAGVWAFPWQYAFSAPTPDANTAMANALTALFADPAAVAQLNQGVLPTFNPFNTTWSNVTTPASWPTIAASIGNVVPTFQAFVAAGAACGLFSQPALNVQAAWSAYVTAGTAPCGTLPQLPGTPNTPVTPVVPPVTPAPSTTVVLPPPLTPVAIIQAPAGSSGGLSTWGAVGLMLLGAGTVGAYFYFKKPHVAHSNPVMSYGEFRTAVANQLINRYGYSYADANKIMDLPGKRSPSISRDLYDLGYGASKSATTIDKFVQRTIELYP